ncbi:MAG TPA: carbon-nitrogen hydrolase family protein [Nitrososphaeraceae archaeon]|nr:carbon-nitrogen hydrolase family protein [Nitrososphaeraceae archaeon]
MKKSYKIALVQMKSSTIKSENLKLSVDYIRQAAKKKVELVCFPEFQMAYSPLEQTAKELSTIAENAINGNFITTLRKEAKRHRIKIIATIYENINTKRKKKTDYRVSDTAIMISEKGDVMSIYRKLHLYDALGFKESAKLVGGDKIERPVKVGIGKIGLEICYDIRFPEMSRILTLDGADVLAIPSGWVQGIMKEEHWQIMLKARAIENGCYVIAPDQVGNIFSGQSMVIDPFGITLLDMGNKEGVEVAEIARDRVESVRQSLPLLKNRRTDVYLDHISSFI